MNTLPTTRSAVSDAFQHVSDTLQDVRSQAAPVLHRVTDQAQRGLELVRDRAAQASDTTVGYVRQQPLKSLLIVAAAGIALIAVAGWLGRPQRKDLRD